MHPEPILFSTDWQGVVLLRVVLLTHLWEGHSQAIINPLMMTGYPQIHPSQMDPPEGDVGAEEAEVARVVVTLMGPTPLGEDVRKRMDFQVKSRSPNLEAMLMMWPVPLGRPITCYDYYKDSYLMPQLVSSLRCLRCV